MDVSWLVSDACSKASKGHVVLMEGPASQPGDVWRMPGEHEASQFLIVAHGATFQHCKQLCCHQLHHTNVVQPSLTLHEHCTGCRHGRFTQRYSSKFTSRNLHADPAPQWAAHHPQRSQRVISAARACSSSGRGSGSSEWHLGAACMGGVFAGIATVRLLQQLRGSRPWQALLHKHPPAPPHAASAVQHSQHIAIILVSQQ